MTYYVALMADGKQKISSLGLPINTTFKAGDIWHDMMGSVAGISYSHILAGRRAHPKCAK